MDQFDKWLEYEKARIAKTEGMMLDLNMVLADLREQVRNGGLTAAQLLTNLSEQRKCLEEIAVLGGLHPIPLSLFEN